MSDLNSDANNPSNAGITGFEPVVNADTRVLILGSAPSVQSLQQVGYYANPQNAFWWIVSQLIGVDLTELDFAQRYEQLLTHRIGLWDVIHSCQRTGSLDASIDRSSAELNDFQGLISQCPNLSTIACNGGLAHTLFRTRVLTHQSIASSITVVSKPLPSSSPAHARQTKHEKLANWKQLLSFD
ncbi:MAG: DNA-deoxyinosine glycosylase [Pseudomonadota bacterium]